LKARSTSGEGTAGRGEGTVGKKVKAGDGGGGGETERSGCEGDQCGGGGGEWRRWRWGKEEGEWRPSEWIG